MLEVTEELCTLDALLLLDLEYFDDDAALSDMISACFDFFTEDIDSEKLS
jgi:hypothetical protein